MKATALKPHKKKKVHYALRAFVWGAVIAALFIVPSIIYDKGVYIYYGDYNMQIIPFYQIMHDAIRSGNFGWNWYTDLGTSFVGGYSYYSLGSPFFWLMLPFPTEAIPYLQGPLTILKFGCSSLAAYIFLKRYVKDKNNAVIGGMLYAFSGFAIYDLVFHFLDILVFFPLLLAALDTFIIDKKYGRFAVMVAVCAIVNYYFFVAEAIFCLIYWIVRMAVKNYKMERKEVLYLFFEAVMGVGMALFILLPSFYLLLGTTRIDNGGFDGWSYWLYDTPYVYARILISFFCPPELASEAVYVTEYSSQWYSLTCWLPLFSMAGVFAIIFNKRRNKWLRVFYAVCIPFMFIPVLNSSFQLFTETKYLRWFFMLLMVMALGSVIALEDPATKWKKPIIANFVAVVLIALIIGFTPEEYLTETGSIIQFGISGGAVTWTYMAIALFNIAVLVVFISLYKRNSTAFRRFSCLLTAIAIISAFGTTFVLGKTFGYVSGTDPVELNMLNCDDNIMIDDIQNWRSDTLTNDDYTTVLYDYDTIATLDQASLAELEAEGLSSANEAIEAGGKTYAMENLTMFWRIPGLECFHSTISSSITDFLSGMGTSRITFSNWPMSRYGYRSFLSVKYMFEYADDEAALSFTDENGEPIMPGWQYLDTQNGYNIYENEYCLPMGFTYDAYISDAEFQEIPIQYRHLALLKCMVVHSVDDMFEMASVNLEQKVSSDLTYTRDEYFSDCEARMKIACYDFEHDNKGFQAKIDTGENEEYVFFSVPYDEGWSAEVNGEPAEIKVVNYGFMAVKVPANTTSTIRFNYHTPGIVYGSVVALVCVLLLVIYLAAIKMQSMPAAKESDTGRANGKTALKKGTTKNDSTEEDSDNSENLKDSPTENESGKESPANNTESGEAANNVSENDDDITLFDIVKETEEQNMMHTYSRVAVALESGYGSVGYDIEGKKYIDFTAGIGVNCLGYSDARWLDAIEKQARTIQHASNLYYNTTQIQLAETLCMKTGYSKVFFANSGAEANECAIKVARKYGSDKYGKNHTHIVTLENSFHGRTITTLAATGQDVFHNFFHPFTEGFSYAKANDIESIKGAVNDNTCAVMIELIQGEGGVNPLDKEFVTELSAYCKENDILLIVDEVQTGVGRTGKLFCYENYDIKPDIVTTAKALGGGLPLSACMCTEELQNVMTYGSNGTTFGGNPIACAGAQVILERVSDEKFLKEVSEKGDYMRSRIADMQGVKEVRGMGMMIGIVLEKDNAKAVLNKCAENGLLVLTAKTLIRLLPPLNIDYYDLEEGLDILESSILEANED